MLRLGSSLQWPEALQMIAGTTEMSSQSLVNYFQPLLDYLADENTKNNDVIGWPDYSWQPPTGKCQHQKHMS